LRPPSLSRVAPQAKIATEGSAYPRCSPPARVSDRVAFGDRARRYEARCTGRGTDGPPVMLAISTVTMPMRKTPSKVPDV
jgi:hypothetical protein